MTDSKEIFRKAFHVIENGFAKNNFSEYENRILWFVFRKTYLWQKEMDAISLGQFEKGTGIHRWHLGEKIPGLVHKKVLLKDNSGYITQYGINPNCQEWDLKKLDKKETGTVSSTSTSTSTRVVLAAVPKLVPPAVPTKKEVYNTKYTQQTEEIYSVYPKKARKNNSIKSIQKLLKSGITKEVLLRAVMNYKAYIQSEEKERKYIIQSNNFFGEEERYKEFLEQPEEETQLNQVELAMQRCKERGDI